MVKGSAGTSPGGFFDNSSSALTPLLPGAPTLPGMFSPISGRVLAPALVSLLIGLTAGACGSSSTSSSTTSASSQDAARVKFAQCMRENGINLPDNPGQGGGGGAIANVDQTKLQAAFKACQKYQRAAVGSISSSQRQSFRDAFTKFAACMRQNGVELPDVGSGNGPPGGGSGNGPPAGGFPDRSDPKVQAATKACQGKLPQGGPGGAGPGGGAQ